MLTHGIRTLLLAQAAITTLAPSQVVKGVTYPAVFCDNPVEDMIPPYIVLISNKTDPCLTLDAVINTSGVSDDIDIVAVGYSIVDARALGQAVQTFFDDYEGPAGSDDTVLAVHLLDETYSYDYPADGRDTKVHKIAVSYNILSRPGG